MVMRLDDDLVSRIVWFDAYISNVDRTVRNPNMLIWHRKPWLIDHGAALYFHHADGWDADLAKARDRFPLIAQHLLLHRAGNLRAVDEAMAGALTPETVQQIVGLIPDGWLTEQDRPGRAAGLRDAYRDYLLERLRPPRAFVDEALRVR
jgi:hypothetical protein